MSNEKHKCCSSDEHSKGCCGGHSHVAHSHSTCGCGNKDEKNEGYNSWTSVPRTYDGEESCHEHKKTATNNQWCSCNK